MPSGLKSILFWLWPPYEAHVARLVIDAKIAGSPKDRMRSIQADIQASISGVSKLSKKDMESLESLAKLVFEAENARRETLENKALEFVSSFGIAVSVISALPVLLGEKWNLSVPVALVLGTLYILGITHLVTAVYWSVTARRVEGLALPSAAEYVKAIQDGKWTSADRIVMHICRAKFNEPILTKKANSLAVAESMFVRGLLFIAVAALITGGSTFFRAGSAPMVACKVPDVVGLDQAAAEGMLFELGLQPIRSNQYDPNIKTGLVIRQDPVAGSLAKPCDVGVTIVISLGPPPIPSPSPVPTNTPRPTETPSVVSPIPTP